MYNFPPSFELVGEIKTVDKKAPTDLKRNPAMKLFIQYGTRRAGDSKRDVNFLNGMYVRVPFFVWQRIEDKIQPGAIVHVKGHLQGIYKMAIESVMTECVVERISFYKSEEEETPAAPAAAAVEAAA